MVITFIQFSLGLKVDFSNIEIYNTYYIICCMCIIVWIAIIITIIINSRANYSMKLKM